MLYTEKIDLKVISDSSKPSGGEMISIHKDGTRTSQPYGNIETKVYECPCGAGTVTLTIENIPGYYDWYARINCQDCDKIWDILWGKGVSPGHSPMLGKKYILKKSNT